LQSRELKFLEPEEEVVEVFHSRGEVYEEKLVEVFHSRGEVDEGGRRLFSTACSQLIDLSDVSVTAHNLISSQHNAAQGSTVRFGCYTKMALNLGLLTYIHQPMRYIALSKDAGTHTGLPAYRLQYKVHRRTAEFLQAVTND
jgi:hypothetical protein